MCDCLVALGPATADGVTRFAKNSDRPADESQRIEWLPGGASDRLVATTYIEVEAPAREGISVLGSRPSWMWGFEHGVNEAGVAAGNETIYTTLDPRPFPDALTGMDLVRLAITYASTAEDAVATIVQAIERYGQGGSGHHGEHRPYWSSFLVADPSAAFVVETSGREYAIEQVTRTRAISNRTTIPAFDIAYRHPRQPVERLVDPRLRASEAVLASTPVMTDALQRHLRDHVGGDDGWTVCMHAGDVEVTTAAIVAELPRQGPPVARVLLGSPCRSVFVPLVVGHPLTEVLDEEVVRGLGELSDSGRAGIEGELERLLRTDDPAWNDEAVRRVRAAAISPPAR